MYQQRPERSVSLSQYTTIFQQFLSLIPRHLFDKTVATFQGNRYVKRLTCWGQFFANLSAQVCVKDRLRDIEIGLKAPQTKWYQLGISPVARSTLADANQKRDSQISEPLFSQLLARCKEITPKHTFRFKNPLYTLDSTVIDLCVSLFPWATFRRRKGAITLHGLLDHRGDLPSVVVMTEGKPHDVQVAKTLAVPLSPDSILVLDRAYVDCEWFWGLTAQKVFFVTRMKATILWEVIGQQDTPNGKGMLKDETIQVVSQRTQERYPQPVRLVTFYDEEHDVTYEFLTNNFRVAPSTIAAIYKARWQVELFFKWIKQHLKIKTFLGTSKHAVLTQIWTAMIHYLLLAYVKYQTKYRYSLLEFSRLSQSALFERIPLVDLLSLNTCTLKKLKPDALQLSLL